MKKKIAMLLMLITMVISLSSCSFIYSLLTGYGSDMSYNFTENDEKSLRTNMQSVETLVQEDKDYNKFYSSISNVTLGLVKISTYYNLAYIDYCKTGSDEALEASKRYRNLLTELISWREDIFIKIDKSSFSTEFFKDLSEEEKNEILNSKKSTEYYDLENANNDIVLEFESKGDNITDAELKEYYIKLIENDNKLAKLTNYDSYMDYACGEVYNRSYKTAEINEFVENVKKYIVPIYLAQNKKYKDLKSYSEVSTPDNYSKFVSYMSSPYNNYSQLLLKYVNALSSNFGTTFKQAMNSNFVTFGTDQEKSYKGAFTTYLIGYSTPAMYFGPGYQTSSTIMHEYGHFYSAYINGGSTEDLDLAETQSQGNEMMYLAYLNNIDYFSSGVEDLIISCELNNILKSIVQCASIYELEVYCHESDDLKEVDLNQIYENICEGYGGYETLKNAFGYDPNLYWKKVVIPHAGYYVSYAISAVSAVSMYCTAIDNFAVSCTCYNDLLGEKSTGFVEALNKSGIYSPFNDATYTFISSSLAAN